MLWLKVLHVFSIIAWFVGLLYLPRLFVYHAKNDNPNVREQFLEMETKLYRMMGIGMLGTLIFGGLLSTMLGPIIVTSAWFYVKLVLVVLLFVHHHYCGRVIKRFRADEIPHNPVFFRWFNEMPAVLLLVILTLVIIKPF